MGNLIKEIIDSREDMCDMIEEYILNTARNVYREYIFERCGCMYEEDVIFECIEKFMVYEEKLRGSTPAQLKLYIRKIVNSVVSEYVRNFIKLDKLNFMTSGDEYVIEYLENKFEKTCTIENALVDKIYLEKFIEELKLSRKERQLFECFRIYGNIRDCCEVNKLSYNAAKQMLYRIRIKARRKIERDY